MIYQLKHEPDDGTLIVGTDSKMSTLAFICKTCGQNWEVNQSLTPFPSTWRRIKRNEGYTLRRKSKEAA